MGALAHPPVDPVFPVQQFALDERTSQLAVIGPELAQDSIDLRLGQPRARWKRSHHLGEDQPAAALAGRPLDDPAVPPERPQLPHLLGSRVPEGGGHVLL